QQQSNGTTEAMAADDQGLFAGVKSFQVASHKRFRCLKGLEKTSVSLAFTIIVSYLACVQITGGVGKHFLSSAHRDQHDIVVMSDERLRTRILVIEEMHILWILPPFLRFFHVTFRIVGRYFQTFGIGHFLAK